MHFTSVFVLTYNKPNKYLSTSIYHHLPSRFSRAAAEGTFEVKDAPGLGLAKINKIFASLSFDGCLVGWLAGWVGRFA